MSEKEHQQQCPAVESQPKAIKQRKDQYFGLLKLLCANHLDVSIQMLLVILRPQK
jgi:hypothetical protein